MSRCKEGQELVDQYILSAMKSTDEEWAEIRSQDFEEIPYIKHLKSCPQCQKFEEEKQNERRNQ